MEHRPLSILVSFHTTDFVRGRLVSAKVAHSHILVPGAGTVGLVWFAHQTARTAVLGALSLVVHVVLRVLHGAPLWRTRMIGG